jgi:preprotein translocase subunit SecY
MNGSTRIGNLLKKKLLKIFVLLIIIRSSLYIPIPITGLDIFSRDWGGSTESVSGLNRGVELFTRVFSAVTGAGGTTITIGCLGMVPYFNASLLVQLLVPLLPSLERLQNEEGTIGRRRITKYTRYLTLTWSILLSSYAAFGVIKPFVFNWNTFIALKIILSLTVGSMLSMWFAELITRENLGNGPSMVVFINIIGGLRGNLVYFISDISNFSAFDRFAAVIVACFIYLVAIFTVIVVQGSYKRIRIISARGELSESSPLMISSIKKRLRRSKDNFLFTYIPLRLNQGGIMPLVFSSLLVRLFFGTLGFSGVKNSLLSFPYLEDALTLGFVVLNCVIILFVSNFYALLLLRPKDLSENLVKMAFSVPGLKPGKETTQYLEKEISRLSFIGGLFLIFLTFLPLVVGRVLKFSLVGDLSSLIILIGVVTDVTSRVKGYLVAQNYECDMSMLDMKL